MNPGEWLQVPRRLWLRLAARPAAQNFSWLVADRGVRLTVGVIVTSWSARYFGKENFGLLNYAFALVTVFAAVIPLGMDALVVRDIIRDESAAGRLIGTVMGFRGATALGCALLSVVAAWLLRPGERLLLAIVSLYAVGAIAQAFESGELLFQARIQMRRLVVPRLGIILHHERPKDRTDRSRIIAVLVRRAYRLGNDFQRFNYLCVCAARARVREPVAI